jgi:hypothetical protein
MSGHRKRYELWHFELRGWRQIIAFDVLMLFGFGVAFMAGRSSCW